MWVIFALLDPGFTDLIESGSNPDTGPKHRFNYIAKRDTKTLY